MFEENSPYSIWDAVDLSEEPFGDFLLIPVLQSEMQAAYGAPACECADTLRQFEGALRKQTDALHPRFRSRARELFQSVPAGLEAAHYHLDRVETIEEDILTMFAREIDLIGGEGIGLGVSLMVPAKLTFEYQAYLLALRRVLDYFANGATAFFSQEGHSFRKLKDTIVNRQPRAASTQLTAVLESYSDLADKILGKRGDRVSPRDRIAHREFLHAGNINIHRGASGYEVRIIGGVEELFPWSVAPSTILQRGDVAYALSSVGPVLVERLTHVEQLLMRGYVALTRDH